MSEPGLLAFIALGMMEIVLVGMLRAHRIDLRPHQGVEAGRSRIWQVNVLDPRNYDSRGKRLLRWLVLLNVLSLAVIVWLVLSAGQAS